MEAYYLTMQTIIIQYNKTLLKKHHVQKLNPTGNCIACKGEDIIRATNGDLLRVEYNIDITRL